MKQIVRYKGGHSLSYAEYGDKNGYPVLVQHGLIASIEGGDIFERLLQLGARLVCIARPGYGESSPYLMKNLAEWGEIVSVLVDELQLGQFDVFGSSSGAPYGYSIGYTFPGRARNIFIFSGIPALYDEKILSHWPYEVKKDASMAELEKLADDLFFSNVPAEDMEKKDMRDSMMNHGFGVAQDMRLRFVDWGFGLSDVNQAVYMQHSRFDAGVPFVTAELTSQLLPHCKLIAKETDVHFSGELLDDFIDTVMAGVYKKAS